jgi:hypothetical protein
MTSTAKAALLLLCFAICALGIVLTPRDTGKREERTIQAEPVNNHQPKRRAWLQV